jgi:hypothetical protein
MLTSEQLEQIQQVERELFRYVQEVVREVVMTDPQKLHALDIPATDRK